MTETKVTGPSRLELDGVEHRYGDELALKIDALTLSGSTVLVGHNGAGKSTLLQLAAGLLMPSAGTVTVNGARAGSIAARRAVSFVPDQPALFDDLTLSKQMDYVARLHGESEPTRSARLLIELLEAEPLLNRVPGAMSKGQRQKASLLVAMARPCTILLTDEPTTGLDADSREALLRAFAQLEGGGLTLISSTHDEDLIAAAETHIELADGRLAVEHD